MRKYWGLLAVLFLSLWIVRPLVHPGFFPMHDDTQVVRVFEMAKALENGQFPVRWVEDLGYGYGYPIFNFYSPLPYYVGASLMLLGFDALAATKIMFIVGILLAGIFMYFLAREFWGEWGGIVSGLFFVYAPYHAVQIYVRGSVDEFWAMAFIPLLVLSFYKTLLMQKWRWVVWGSLSYTAIILSHNLTALMVSYLIIPLIIFSFYRGFKLHHPLVIGHWSLVILSGLGLSAFYWLPALSEMRLTNVFSQIGGGADFKNHFLCLWQLWNSAWGYGGSAPGCLNDGLSFKIGKLHLLLTGLTAVIAVLFWKKERFRAKVILFFIFLFLFSIFMTLDISGFLWSNLPGMAFIQYPWRFLTLIVFFSSFLTGAVSIRFKNRYLKGMVGGFLLILLLFYNIKYFQPQKYLLVNAGDYLTEENIKWQTSKISDEYLPKNFPRPKSKEDLPLIGEILKNKPLEYNFKVNNPIRTLANFISLFTLILIAGGSLYVWKKES